MIRRAFVVIAVAAFGLIFAGLAIDYDEQRMLPPLGESYVRLAPQELATPNVITGILLAYRGFDTLGEVAVLFMVAAGVGLVLGGGAPAREEAAREAEEPTPSSELVQNGAKILLPLISIFAAYIIMNGHISAGGGFQGGAVIASGVLLMLLARPRSRINLGFLSATESLAGVIFAGGFLDNRVLPLGEFGAFFSAGTIPVLSVLLGVKVGCELSVIIDRFRA